MKIALVLHSGGMDSTVCLLKAKNESRKVISLGIDYGQRHKIELEYAQVQCKRYGVERRLLRVAWDKPDRHIPTGRSLDEIRSGISPAFLPMRNAVFLTLACAEAVGIQAEEVWIGVNDLDYSGYPDCRPEFIGGNGDRRKMVDKRVPSQYAVLYPEAVLKKAGDSQWPGCPDSLFLISRRRIM